MVISVSRDLLNNPKFEEFFNILSLSVDMLYIVDDTHDRTHEAADNVLTRHDTSFEDLFDTYGIDMHFEASEYEYSEIRGCCDDTTVVYLE